MVAVLEIAKLTSLPFIIQEWKRTQNLKVNQLRDLQNKKLRAIVKHSYNHVPYYHKLFKKENLTPDDIATIEDLKKIPITKKTDISNLPTKEITANNFDLSKCEVRNTSGSSGIPLVCYRDGKDYLKRCFDEYLFHLSHNEKIRDKRVLIGGIVPPPPNTLQRMGVLQTKDVSPLRPPREQIEEIKEYDAKVLLTNPSSALAISKEARESDTKGIELSLIFAVGEFLCGSTRRFIEETFEAKVIDQYGATEVGKISRECNEHSYHTHHNIIVQTTKDDETLFPGEEGEITVTNIANFAQPFIRYDLQDSGLILEDECSCGLPFPLMKLTSGRLTDFISLPDGRFISALEANDFLSFMHTELKQYQVTQEDKDRLTVKLVKGKGFKENTITEIKKTYAKNLGVDIKIDVLVVNDIPKEKSGKFKLFKTNIARRLT
jgi:phenylacetate-CoA ligase